MASRNPAAGTPTPSVDVCADCTNKSDGLVVGADAGRADVDLMAIGPNKPRPMETGKTSYLFGNFGD